MGKREQKRARQGDAVVSRRMQEKWGLDVEVHTLTADDLREMCEVMGIPRRCQEKDARCYQCHLTLGHDEAHEYTMPPL